MAKTLHWRHCMNAYNFYHGIDDFAKLVRQAGYYYFVWQDEVYHLSGDGYYNPDIRVEDIE